MLEIYHPPHVAREEAARKMLWRVLLSFAALAVSMIPFFFQLTKDSEQNRDAVYKTTSTETELCLILVLAAALAVIFYLSVTGIRLSRKIRAQFKEHSTISPQGFPVPALRIVFPVPLPDRNSCCLYCISRTRWQNFWMARFPWTESV